MLILTNSHQHPILRFIQDTQSLMAVIGVTITTFIIAFKSFK